LQAKLPALSSNSLHIIVDGATHDTLIAEHILVVVDALRQILEAARTGEHFGRANGDALNVIRPKPGNSRRTTPKVQR